MLKPLPRLSLVLFSLVFSCSLFAQTPTPGDNRRCVDDARISLAFSGDTVRNTCIDDDVTDRLRFQVNNFRQSFAYIVVDANDIVQFVDFSNFINFDMLPSGQLKVYAFSNYGNILVEVGDTFTGATLSLPCAGLTLNHVTINNGMSGDITIESDQDTYDVCSGDGSPDEITVTTVADNAVYVITDDAGNVLALNESGTIDFEGVDPGTCRIYALAGGLSIEPGQNVSILDGQGSCGSGLSQNFITVNRIVVAGGSIATDDGALSVQTCPGDGNDDIIAFTVTDATGENNRLIITDENNVIIGLPMDNTANFDAAPVGTCRAWNLSYTGDLDVAIGQSAEDVLAGNSCASLSDNFVEVVREVPEGGSILTTDGQSTVQTCPGDGVDDIIEVVVSGASGGDIVYLLTNEANEILNFSNEPSFNLEGAPVGTCRIWAVAYQGTLTFAPGDDAAVVALADNCFDLSDDFVTVIRAVPAGGTVATEAGETSIAICPGDGADDLVSFASTGASGTNFTYLVTDENNIILDVPAGNIVNFEAAGIGVCRLWGLSYEGDLLAMADQNAAITQLATECFSLSDNFVTVTRELPSGGTVSLSNGATNINVCPGDGVSDLLTFTNTGATGENFAYIITDDNGNILAFPTEPSVDFETVPPGICRVYGLAYSGDILATTDDNINEVMLATACAALSDNFVTVNRINASTGTVSIEGGALDILVCPGDAIPDVVRFDSTGTTLSNFNYLVTDTNNVILQLAFTDAINFETLPAGTCRVWGLGYDGIPTAQPGLVAGVDPLATQCSALSENFVTVTKQTPDGGTITTTDGETEVMICPMDGIADIVSVSSTGNSTARFFFVATTDENVVLSLQDSPDFDFDDAPFGICRIWGLSFQGTLLVEPGDVLTDIQLAEGCADLSDNFVTVIRTGASVGTISLADGGDIINTCPDDGMADIVEFSVTGASEDVIFLITNDQDTLLATSGDPFFDFDGAGTGTCRVYALSFDGDLVVSAGTEVTTAMLASGCFALSENYVTVVREAPVGGSVSLEDGSTTVDFCSGDGNPDILRFSTTSATMNYGYIISDNGIALTGIMTDTFDFSNALTGTFEIYGIAYTGSLSVSPGLDIFNSPLSTDCYELSDDFITVNITRVEGGDILGNGATELYFCPENPDDGLVTFTNNSLISNENYVYVITTANDAQVILSILDGDSFDFGALPLMEVKVFAISYTGDFIATPGTSLAFSTVATGCVGISNNCVRVINDSPEAGEITVDNLSGTGISCVVDGDVNISVSTTSESLAGYAVIITDTDNVIRLISTDPGTVPFGDLPEGDYRAWGLSYTGNITATIGNQIDVDVLADNCYELTETFVPITRGGEISAGMLQNITTADGADTITFCLEPGSVPIVIVEPTVASLNYRYFITDADDRVIAANLPSNVLPLAGFGAGEYRIYGFNFTGTITVGVNQILTGTTLSTECYALTSNFITILLEDPDGGMVLTDTEATEIEVEIDETSGTPVAIVNFINTSGSTSDYAYVITDEDNIIIGTSNSSTIDFGMAGVGVCRVWGVSYSGNLTAVADQDAAAVALSDECFELSENFVTVTRVEEDGLDTGGLPGGLGDVGVAGSDNTTELTAFPNPSPGNEIFITIESDLPLNSGQLSVRDINGQTYQVQPLNGGNRTETIRLDLSELPSGIYFATYIDAAGIHSLQFIKP